ncbi:hypothetical protein KFU94_04840 [Chloroflexi bacterium TSY]|nr:hypothetical protein [Chloroflexi bacterium TSY]
MIFSMPDSQRESTSPASETEKLLYPDALARRRTVLVAVMNNADDLRRAASEG